MVDRLRRNLLIGVPAALALRPFAAAAQAPLRIEITEGVIEPMPFAAPGFVPDSAAAADLAARITQVVIDDLTGTGLFREIPSAAHIGRIANFDAPVAFADWKAINAQALITGAVGTNGDRAQVRFRLWDVFAQQGLGEGLQFEGGAGNWRRLAHKVADAVYARLTGESGYFDSRVAFIAASGPKEARRKQLAIMDYDGANAVMLTDGSALVLTPRLSPDAQAGALHQLRAGRAEGDADAGGRRQPDGDRRHLGDDLRAALLAGRAAGGLLDVGRDRVGHLRHRHRRARAHPAHPQLVDRHRAGLLAGRQLASSSRATAAARSSSTSCRPPAARRGGSASARGATRRRSGRRAAT